MIKEKYMEQITLKNPYFYKHIKPTFDAMYNKNHSIHILLIHLKNFGGKKQWKELQKLKKILQTLITTMIITITY